MALNPSTNGTMSARITAPDANYPYGSTKDESSPGADDGTPYFKGRGDDIFGFQQWLLSKANIVPSGNADNINASDYGDALNILMGGAGRIITKASANVPLGYLECDGSAVSRTTYAALFADIGTLLGIGDGATTFNLPDLRGEFLRGWDNGRGVDSGRAIATYQADELESHTHDTALRRSNGSSDLSDFAGAYTDADDRGTSTSTATGGSETRPRNAAVMYCIRY